MHTLQISRAFKRLSVQNVHVLALSQWSRRVCLYIFILQYYRSFRIIFKDSNKLYTLVRHQNNFTTNINIAIKPGLLSVRSPAAGGHSLQCQGIDNFSVVVGNGISPKCSLASPWHIIWDTNTSTVDASVRNYACPALSCYKNMHIDFYMLVLHPLQRFASYPCILGKHWTTETLYMCNDVYTLETSGQHLSLESCHCKRKD